MIEDWIDRVRSAGRLVETHASWVILGEHFVYKLKKPVDFGFLDFSTLAKRKADCEREVELNERLAPHVYLGLVAVRSGAGGLGLADPDADEFALPSLDLAKGEEGQIVEWAVKMRRLADDHRADSMLLRGQLNQTHMARLGETLARFHAQCKTGPDIARFGLAPAVESNVRENFLQMRAAFFRYLNPAEEAEIEGWQLAFLERNALLFEERSHAGRVRDGHGDLRLEHVYFEDDDLLIIDCIEFNERFRYADVACDLAFLTMDLRHRQRIDLAEALSSRYAEAARDFGLYRVLDFYESYRAYVRGKVAALLDEAQMSRAYADPGLFEEARRLFLHALASTRPPLARPLLIVVGGLVASGKTTLSRRLRRALNAPCIDTDTSRKTLFSSADPSIAVCPGDASFAGMYDAEHSARVYDYLFEGGAAILAAGRSVILEGNFRKRALRDRARALAAGYDAELVFIWCEVPEETARHRLQRRENHGGVSDARLENFAALRDDLEAPTPDERAELCILDTSADTASQGQRLRAAGLELGDDIGRHSFSDH